jgi:CheY-like chemotaxis protein
MPDSTQQNQPVTVSLSVVWQNSSGKQDARMSEIGMEGCFIDCHDSGRSLGDVVEFKVQLPNGPWVSLRGELVDEQYPVGFGLRFTGLTDGDRRLLAQVVRAHGGDPGEVPEPSLAELEIRTGSGPDKRRVLVADDDPLTLRMISAIAETEGFKPVAAADGQQALDLLRSDGDFLVAIFDMNMPHMQGLDLIRFMNGDQRLRRIPVGMITAEKDPKIWDDTKAAGALIFLPKPFTPPQVQMMLRMLSSKAGG